MRRASILGEGGIDRPKCPSFSLGVSLPLTLRAMIICFLQQIYYKCENYLFNSQTERAYQKQAPIFQNRKRVLGQVVGKKKELRYVRNVGLGFKTPKDVSITSITLIWLAEKWQHGCCSKNSVLDLCDIFSISSHLHM